MHKQEETDVEEYETQALRTNSKVDPGHHTALGTLAINSTQLLVCAQGLLGGDLSTNMGYRTKRVDGFVRVGAHLVVSASPTTS